jgi:signal transduction histidine kinase/DNA-binding NarL/FixJ family response regulator/HPt (histidine-containing phosphotransfer) domain-containing protein
MSHADLKPRFDATPRPGTRGGASGGNADLLADIEAALEPKASLLTLPPKLEERYDAATWRSSNKSLRLWLIWAAMVDLLCIGIDAVAMPDHIVESVIARGVVLTGIYLGAASLLTRRRPFVIQGLALVVPTLALIVVAYYLGSLAGGVHLERYLTAAMFVSFAATIVPNVRVRWISLQTALSVLILGAFMLHQANGSLTRMVFDNVELVTFYPVSIFIALHVRARLERIHRRNFLMTWRDELRLADLALSNSRREAALSSMTQGILLREPDGLIPVVNRRAVELLGLPEESMKGRMYNDDLLRHQAARGEFARGIEGMQPEDIIAARSGDASRIPLNYERQRPDGTILEVRSRLLAGGGIVRTYTDITERKRSEAALAKARDIAELALANMTQGIIVRQGDGQITVINRRAIELLGLPERFMHEAITSKDILKFQRESGEFNAPDTAEDLRSTVNDPDGDMRPANYERRRPNGIVLEVRSTTLPGGGFVRTYTDVTERKRNEAALAKARDVAEAASRARSEFLAMMSHEIRTPMNAVLGFTSSLLETKLDEDQRKSAEAIQEASDGLLNILNDILDLSKLDAGRLQFETLPFSPEAVLDNAKSMIAMRAADKGLALVAEIDPNLPKALLGDPGRIRQIVLNLVSNAVKFTAAGEVAISAQCVQRDADRAVVRISVRDSGMGIAPERLERLFTDFVQADASIHRHFGGTGLGLAICKRLVEQMGGEISVQSAPGKGSTFSFWVSLPTADVADLALLSPPSEAIGLREQLVLLGRPLRILIAEDNATNQMVVTRMLKEFDIDLHIARDGIETVEAATEDEFDAIFMDMRMPRMDGLDATRAIRALDGAHGAVPIIALTANAFADDVKACRDAGMDDFVAKPIRKRLLVEKLAAIAGAASGSELRELRHPQFNPAVVVVPHAASQTGAEDAVLIDRSVTAEICQEIGVEAVAEILQAFRREGADRIERLRKLSGTDDRKSIEVEAHTLKGAAGAVGFAQVSTLAFTLEKQVKTMASKDHAALIARIGVAYTQSCAEIDAHPLTEPARH